jgi:hypothetical protein
MVFIVNEKNFSVKEKIENKESCFLSAQAAPKT